MKWSSHGLDVYGNNTAEPNTILRECVYKVWVIKMKEQRASSWVTHE